MRVTFVVAGLALLTPLLAEESAKSGIDKNGSVPAFEVLDVTGPNATKTLCYR